MSGTTPYNNSNLTLFTPDQISGLSLWLDASDTTTITTSGTNVTQWRDKSSNAFTCISNANYVGTTLPTFTAGTNYIQFANTQALVTSQQWTNFTTWSCFVAMNSVNLGTGRWLISTHSGASGRPVFMSMNQGTSKIWNTGFNSAPADITGNHIEYTSAENAAANGQLLWYRDGTLQASNTKTLGAGSGVSYMGIGANATLSNAMSGTYQIYEILIFGTFFNTAQRQQIESYLAWKWNLQRNLPSTQPYFNNPYNIYYGLSIPNTNLTNTFSSLPNQIPGLSLWLDGADSSTVLLSNTNVTQWSDKSGNANHATQVTDINRPTYNSSEKAINLSGSSQFLNITNPNNLVSNTTFSIFIIEKRGSSASQNYILGGGDGLQNGNLHVGYRTDIQYTLAFFTSDLNASVTSYNSLNEPTRLWLANYNGSQQTISLNGTNIGSRAQTTNLVSWNNGSIGRYLTTNFYNGKLYEILFFKPSLTTRQQQQIEGYLAWKWNLQSNLPTNHPSFINSLPVSIPVTVTNYNFSPTSISDTALWLDAADSSTVVRTGVNVSQWNDKSGNGRNLTSVLSGSGTITYVDTSLRFFNTAYMFRDVAINFQNYTFFIIGRTLSTSGTVTNQYVFCLRPNSGASYNSSDAFSFYYDYNSAPTSPNTRFYGANFNTNISDNVTFSNLVLNCYTENTGGSLISYLYGNNGTIKASTTRATTAQGFAAGAQYNNVYQSVSYNNIQLNEIILFPRVLTTAERQRIEGYLAWKWRLQTFLPSSHPFFNFPPG